MVEADVDAGATAGMPLPAAALVRHDGGTIVFVQAPGNGPGMAFEARPVRILSQGGETVSVDGVREGEIIAVRGVSGLKAMLAGVGRQ
jgi:hypothetical protein